MAEINGGDPNYLRPSWDDPPSTGRFADPEGRGRSLIELLPSM